MSYLNSLLQSDAFLNSALGLCQGLILFIPIFAKKNLFDRTPKPIWKKTFIKRINPAVYFLAVISFIGITLIYLKDQISRSQLNLSSTDKKELVSAINSKGYEWDSVNKKLNSIGLILKKNKVVLKKVDKRPQLTFNNDNPIFVDTFYYGKNKDERRIILPLFNIGNGKATDTKSYLTFILKGENTKPQSTNLITEVADLLANKRTYLRYKLMLSRQMTDADTLYLINQVFYRDSTNRKYITKRMNFFVRNDFGLSWRYVTDPAINVELNKYNIK